MVYITSQNEGDNIINWKNFESIKKLDSAIREVTITYSGKEYIYSQDCLKRGLNCQITQHPLNFWRKADSTFDFGTDDTDMEILATINAGSGLSESYPTGTYVNIEGLFGGTTPEGEKLTQSSTGSNNLETASAVMIHYWLDDENFSNEDGTRLMETEMQETIKKLSEENTDLEFYYWSVGSLSQAFAGDI